MKFKYIIMAFLAIGMSVSCTETTKVEPDEYVAPLYLHASDSKIVFDKDGGKAIITVATNSLDWTYEVQSGDWFEVGLDADSCIVVEAPVNSGVSVKTDKIDISASRGEESVSVSLNISQRGDSATDLSAEGTANCYIAHTNGSFKFRADVKGNAGPDGKTKYIETQGLEIKDAVCAELLWEARNDGDRTMSYEIIDGAPVYGGGYVSFSTGRSEGNAVIAVEDATGKVLWSWHIWVTDNEPVSHDHMNPEGKVIAQIMDRNLGALNNTPMDVNNRGMFYQMGRKDPFIPSRSPYADYSALKTAADSTMYYCGNVPEWNLQNLEIGDGKGAWEIDAEFTSQAVDTAPGNIPFSVQHPMRFLVSYYASGSEWYSSGSDEDSIRPGLWGEEKTIFDPCPQGYKVPSKDMWGTSFGDETIKTGGRTDEYGEDGELDTYAWNVEKNCGRVWKPTGDFYPMVGNIYPARYTPGSTPYNYASGQTMYLTSQESAAKKYSAYHVAVFNGYWAYYEARAQVYSGQVRCIKE